MCLRRNAKRKNFHENDDENLIVFVIVLKTKKEVSIIDFTRNL